MEDCNKLMSILASKIEVGVDYKPPKDIKPLDSDVIKKPKSWLCVQNIISVREFVHRSVSPQIFEAQRIQIRQLLNNCLALHSHYLQYENDMSLPLFEGDIKSRGDSSHRS